MCGGCGSSLRAFEFRILEKKLQDPCAVPMCLPIKFLKSITRNFSKEQQLGRGGYGVVYKMRLFVYIFPPLNFSNLSNSCGLQEEFALSFGLVSAVGNCRNGKSIAVKKLFQMHIDENDQFLKEITSLLKLKHQNIVRLIGYCAESLSVLVQIREKYVMAEEQQRLLCFGYLNNMSLHEHISGMVRLEHALV
ncbi:hypothetical protein BAE44_0013478 [Dichanthelium oligosanthes]|uniref:Protein kinase domain-containing protein n=1 Tax=Dichanthelium oligosanthes TaxID=888268 RepID=A0A1E5VK97_9POAL|nr:hypothetical protein BAE44_0013478 [Dichanthelium oligosanthes]